MFLDYLRLARSVTVFRKLTFRTLKSESKFALEACHFQSRSMLTVNELVIRSFANTLHLE